jgi:hypothetical protein
MTYERAVCRHRRELNPDVLRRSAPARLGDWALPAGVVTLLLALGIVAPPTSGAR